MIWLNGPCTLSGCQNLLEKWTMSRIFTDQALHFDDEKVDDCSVCCSKRTKCFHSDIVTTILSKTVSQRYILFAHCDMLSVTDVVTKGSIFVTAPGAVTQLWQEYTVLMKRTKR